MGSAITLYCPTGKVYSVLEPANALTAFEEQCQCQDGAQCRFETDHVALGCSSMLGPLIEWNFNVKDACILHDICYETGRIQAECDNEFYHNYLQLCRPGFHAAAMVGLGIGCDETAEAAWKLVRDFGKFYIKPPQCDRSYTTPCQEKRDFRFWN